ncbi:MAG: alpha/beta hydrolase [Verrucomicrobiota bacterium]
MSLKEDRKQWEEHARRCELPSSVELEEDKIANVPTLWIHSKCKPASRTIIYAHGGGLISGSTITHRKFAADLALATQSSFLLIGYRLLPEHAFPAPLEDILTVYRELTEKRPENILLAGDSSGAGLALAALIQLRDSGESLPAGAFFLSGAFDMTLSGKTMVSNNGKDPLMNLASLKQWQQRYFDNTASPLLSPLYGDLSELPPVLLLAGGKELWLSDSQRLAEKLEAAGSNVSLRIWDSMTHVWAMNPDLEESNEAIREIGRFVSNF